MEWFLWILLSFLILLFVLFLPLVFSFKMKIDIKENLFVLKIKLFCFHIKTVQKEILSLNFKKKNKKMQKFFWQFLKEIKITNFQILCEVGNKSDAMQTALLCGGIKVLCSLLFVFLNNCEIVNTKYEIKPCFYETKMKVCVKLKILFSLLTIILCFIKTKGRKYGKRIKRTG